MAIDKSGTHCGSAPAAPNTRRRWRLLAVSVAVVAAGAGFVSCHVTGRDTHPPYRQGSCVAITADEPGGELHGHPAGCDTDTSFTIAKVGDPSGNCGNDRYTQFQPPFSDVATGRLCLIPNLVVGHCYRWGVPVGKWDPVSCANLGRAAIRVVKRVDHDDPHACPIPSERVPTPSSKPALTLPAIPVPKVVPMAKQLRYPSRVYCFEDRMDQ